MPVRPLRAARPSVPFGAGPRPRGLLKGSLLQSASPGEGRGAAGFFSEGKKGARSSRSSAFAGAEKHVIIKRIIIIAILFAIPKTRNSRLQDPSLYYSALRARGLTWPYTLPLQAAPSRRRKNPGMTPRGS